MAIQNGSGKPNRFCCDGLCNQGRDCPYQGGLKMDIWIFVIFLVAVVILGLIVGYGE